MRNPWKCTLLTACAGMTLLPAGASADPYRGDRGTGDRGRVERQVNADRRSDRTESVVEKRVGGDGDYRKGGRSEYRAEADVKIDRKADRRWRDRPGRDRIVRGHRYIWGPGIAFYLSDGYYYGECRWLKRRAVETGDRIWWRRYERCRDFS